MSRRLPPPANKSWKPQIPFLNAHGNRKSESGTCSLVRRPYIKDEHGEPHFLITRGAGSNLSEILQGGLPAHMEITVMALPVTAGPLARRANHLSLG